MGWIVGLLVALVASWLVFVAVLAIARPKGVDLREAARLLPDVVRLVRDLAKDPSLPAGIRRRLGFLVAYLAFPIDLVPDVVPVLGYADDVIVVALVLRSVVRRADADAIDGHWSGTPAGLALVRSLTGLR